MSPSKTAPSAKTVSIKLALNAKPIKSQIAKTASFLGGLATTPTTLIASVNGQHKKKIPVPSVRKHGTLLRLQNNDNGRLF
jgi:hypothetical protein